MNGNILSLPFLSLQRLQITVIPGSLLSQWQAALWGPKWGVAISLGPTKLYCWRWIRTYQHGIAGAACSSHLCANQSPESHCILDLPVWPCSWKVLPLQQARCQNVWKSERAILDLQHDREKGIYVVHNTPNMNTNINKICMAMEDMGSP